jgi:hypothetical protein
MLSDPESRGIKLYCRQRVGHFSECGSPFRTRTGDVGSLRLQIWDGVKAAGCSFGDFFVSTRRTVAFQSALFASPEGRSYNCYIPMPFGNQLKWLSPTKEP